jgi:hypothetical protein
VDSRNGANGQDFIGPNARAGPGSFGPNGRYTPRGEAGAGAAAGGGLLFGCAGEEPEQIGEAVDEVPQDRAQAAAVGRECGQPAFAAARRDPGRIKRGGEGVGAGRGPAVEFQAARLEGCNRGVEADEIGFRDFFNLEPA